MSFLISDIGSNPCQMNNGGCSQLCLPTSETTRTCMCTVGYNLRKNRMSCQGEHCSFYLSLRVVQKTGLLMSKIAQRDIIIIRKKKKFILVERLVFVREQLSRNVLKKKKKNMNTNTKNFL